MTNTTKTERKMSAGMRVLVQTGPDRWQTGTLQHHEWMVYLLPVRLDGERRVDDWHPTQVRRA